MVYKLSDNVLTTNDDGIRYAGKTYRIILGITPQPTNITLYGIYDKFVSSGIYVYKMLDYSSQVGYIKHAKHRQIGNRSTNPYIFIGDIFDQMYPLNRL